MNKKINYNIPSSAFYDPDTYFNDPDNYFRDTFDEEKYFNLLNSLSYKKYLFYTGVHHKNGINVCREVDKLDEPEPKHIDGPDFKYFLNEYGFRSKSFFEFNKKNTNILFVGCSITFGTGLPEESTWYKKFINKINIKNVDYYNLSINGAGTQVLIKNIITFINTVGKPDYIFMYLPNISRLLKWDENEYKGIGNDLFVDKKNLIGYSVEDTAMWTSTLLHLLELLCDLSNIKLIWSTWMRDQADFYKSIGFKHYFDLDFNISDLYVTPPEIHKIRNPKYVGYKYEYDKLLKDINKKNINNEPYWSSARDGWHFGSLFSETVSEKFLIEFNRKFNDKN